MTERGLSKLMDILRGNQSFQVRSPLCIAQWCLIPSEPYRLVNLDGGCNGWRVVVNYLPQAGQALRRGELTNQDGLGSRAEHSPPRTMAQVIILLRGKVQLGAYAGKRRYHTRGKYLFRVPGHLEQIPRGGSCMEPLDPVAKGLLVHTEIDG